MPQASPLAAPRAQMLAVLHQAPPRARVSAGRRVAVRVLKRLLPAAAIVLLAAIALWPHLTGSDDARRYTFRVGGNLLNEPMRMREARFQGVDDLGRPYTLTASEAIQRGGDDDTIDLVEPKGDITLQDGAWMMLQGATGVFHRQPRVLDLDGGVVLNHDGGYEVRTERASIDLKDQVARGDRPVEAQGPLGTIEGTGFVAEEGGKVITVIGPATMVIRSNQQ